MKLVYFAHPVTHYNTEYEEDCIDKIKMEIPSYEGEEIEVFSPNQEWLQRVYKNRKRNGHEDPFSIFRELVDACDITVGATYFNGNMGAGVYNECSNAKDKNMLVYVINQEFELINFMDFRGKVLDIKQTREVNKKRER